MCFERNVFINCPFDDTYSELLKAMIFTLLYVDLEPKLSETISSGHMRIEEIKKLIGQSRLSIHDISRNAAVSAGDLPRFNMPYELGIDVGCQSFGPGALKDKVCLIFDNKQYEYHKYMSDIGGQDIKMHKGEPEELIKKLWEWLVVILNEQLPSPNNLWNKFLDFEVDFNVQLTSKGFTPADIAKLPFSYLISITKEWITKNRS